MTPSTQSPSYTVQSFAQSIKNKYPDGVTSDGKKYAELGDQDLTDRVVAKYPVYKSQITDIGAAQQKTDANVNADAATFKSTGNEGALGASAKVVGNIPSSAVNFGKGVYEFLNPLTAVKSAENLGSGLGDYANATDEPNVSLTDVAKEVPGTVYNAVVPKFLQHIFSGDLKSAAQTIENDPVGQIAPLLMVARGAAEKAGKAAEFDNAVSNISKTATKPVRAAINTAGRLAGEAEGAATGAGYGSIKQGIASATEGGAKGKAFTDALRGNTSPEGIVSDAKDALQTIVEKRGQDYKTQLQGLKTNTKEFDPTPLVDSFNKKLNDFGVTADPEGKLDFSRSPGLGRYKNDLEQLSKTLQSWGTKPGDNTVVGIDKLKQTLDDFRIGSQDSKKFDSFVSSLRNEAKGLIKGEPGYDKLVGDYENSTGLIKEIQKGLSLGDKNQVDTSFRKLTSALRTNNEFRKQLVKELDDASGGMLSSKIAGQQLSEILPRGLARIVEGVTGVGALSKGVGVIQLLKTAMLTSPRLVGEFINALGISKRAGSALNDALGSMATKFSSGINKSVELR